jgi:hypothetical protein
MTPTEEAIVNLRGQGKSYAEIVEHGFYPDQIRAALSIYGTVAADMAERAALRRNMTQGSRQLLLAVLDLLDAIHKARAA